MLLLFWYIFMRYLLILLTSILYIAPLSADTKVDGFFPEDKVKEGYFKGKPGFENQEEASTNKHRFFVTREERRLHPELAPSNNIVVPKRAVRVSSVPVVTSNGVITNVWTAGIVNK